jgi:hypothetical protein
MMHADEDDADERPAVAVDVVAGADGVPSSCARAGGAAGEEAVCCFSPATGFHSAKEAGSWPWDWRASLASVEEDERGRAGRRARGNRGARSSRTGQKPRVGMNWAQTPRAPVPVH